ncbi:hypothetical protein ONR57_01665 [Hoyosella sp. YIM 151337]|uniref:hypothetical protein n=1 Tax=Hoyosella sp. YIM 151337 TaxID=2992742 RepID=UPI00223658F9|nr:hypothetical protein [Hoyosella sp. YIM 151337]MCW4352004.1 hypothetical protein [Hoyosella sp. YIM 151337]
MRRTAAALAILALTAAACASDGGDPGGDEPAATTTPVAPVTPTETATSEAEMPPPPPASPQPATQAPAPVIVDCQTGLGPIVTYWSDGSVTGYSDYCQSVHDEVLRHEREANTFECDGVVCRNPYTGVEMPDPSATHVPDYSGGPSSGEVQMRYACEQGYADRADCESLGFPFGE